MNIKLSITILLLLAFVACSTHIYIPSDANVNKHEQATLVELQQGHDLYQNSCGKCHKIPKPENHTPEQWSAILAKMGPKAKLNADQISKVYKYVVNF